MRLVPARAIEAARDPGSCGPDGSCHHRMLTHLRVGPLRVSAPHLQRATGVRGTGSGTAKAQHKKPLAVQDTRACGRKWPVSGWQPPRPGMGPHRKWKHWPLGMAKDLVHSFASRGYFPQTKLLQSFVSSLGQQCPPNAVDTAKVPTTLPWTTMFRRHLQRCPSPWWPAPSSTVRPFTSPKRKPKYSS